MSRWLQRPRSHLLITAEALVLVSPSLGPSMVWFGALKKGDIVQLAEMSSKITKKTADGRPQQARFTFAVDLDSELYLFLYWADSEYRPFKLPEPGETIQLPAEDIFQTLFASIGNL